MSESKSNQLTERHYPKNVNLLHQSQMKAQDKLALAITAAVGTMQAVYFLVIIMAGWILWQTQISARPFDPYPFAFLLFLGNIVQLLLMPLIMVSQNIQGKHAEIRAEEEFRATASIYKDIEHLLARIDQQDQEFAKQTALLEKLTK